MHGINMALHVLTYRFVGDQRLVVEAENLGDIVEIGMLSHKSPLGVVHLVVEVGHSNLHSPIILVIDLHMPMHSYGTHVLSALQQWCVIFSWSVNPRRFQPLRVSRPDNYKLKMQSLINTKLYFYPI